MQRELNQNLAEQARIQAMRAKHQQQMQARAAPVAPSSGQKQPFDPNNYSFQQVSPPIQYSYYQPYGDAVQQPQQQAQKAAQNQPPVQPINIDLNNLNFDLPTPQAAPTGSSQSAGTGQQQAQQQQQQPQLVPSFTGAGGLPVMQPPAAVSSQDQSVPMGQAPLAPQAQKAQGPPLTEADFRDITGGENYGAPGGADFGLASAGADGPQPMGAGASGAQQPDNTEAQLREFGMGDSLNQQNGLRKANRRQDLGGFDFGGLDAVGLGNSGGSAGRRGGGGARRPQSTNPFNMDFFSGGNSGGLQQSRRRQPNDFDFASQPSSDQASSQGGAGASAPGSLQALLGGGFPGLGNGRDPSNMGLESLAGGLGENGGAQQDQQRADDGLNLGNLAGAAGGPDGRAEGMADLGDMGGLGGLGDGQQPDQEQGQDGQEFGLAAAAAAPQPKSVPYPDGGPQFVGTLWALGQPQSLTQTRYNPLPDKGTYQDYPAYRSGGNHFEAVRELVDSTPAARPPGPGRYAQPALDQLAPDWRSSTAVHDYSRSTLNTDNEVGNTLGSDFEE